MQINSLYIKSYKILNDLNIEEFNNPVSLFIGINGSGKSSLLEAIAKIFSDLYLQLVEERKPENPIEFEITYSIRLSEILEETTTTLEERADYVSVSISGNQHYKGFYKISTDNNTFSTKQLIEKHGYSTLLPNIAGYYSGFSETLLEIFNAHQEIYVKRLREMSESKDEAFGKIGHHPFFYYRSENYKMFLLGLLSFEYSEDISGFLQKFLQVKTVTKVEIIIKKRAWDSKKGPEEFWGAKGELRNFLIASVAYFGRELENCISPDGNIIFSAPDVHVLYSLKDYYGEEKKLFQLLDALNTQDMLEDIHIEFELLDGARVKEDQFSEGQQQVIVLKGINELILTENSIALFDEPDTYQHPQWQSKFMEQIEQYTENTHFVITSHSPIILSNLKEGEVFKISGGVADLVETKYFGRDYGHNMEALMEHPSRNQESRKDLDELFALIEKEKYPEASKLLKQLQKKYGENEPELTRAYTMINLLKE